MKPLNNYVEIEVPSGTRPVKVNGKDFFIDNSYEPGRHVISYGVITNIPYSLTPWEWETKMNIRIGDKVWVQKLEAILALGRIADPSIADYEENTAYYIENGRIRVFIPYSALFFVERDNKTIMLNGFSLIEPIEVVYDLPFLIPDTMIADEVRKGRIVEIGDPNIAYDYEGYVDALSYKVGDEVYFTRYQNDPQFDYKDRKLFKIQRRFIIGLIKN